MHNIMIILLFYHDTHIDETGIPKKKQATMIVIILFWNVLNFEWGISDYCVLDILTPRNFRSLLSLYGMIKVLNCVLYYLSTASLKSALYGEASFLSKNMALKAVDVRF